MIPLQRLLLLLLLLRVHIRLPRPQPQRMENRGRGQILLVELTALLGDRTGPAASSRHHATAGGGATHAIGEAGLVVDEDGHPDADLAVAADERGEVDPAVLATAIFVVVVGGGIGGGGGGGGGGRGGPADFGGDFVAVGEGLGQAVADAGGAADEG